ncbi:MAG: glycosyltransferase, partial [Rhodothermales bacterium]
MTSEKHIVYVMTGAVASNSRALRQLKALAPFAQRITVVTQEPVAAKKALGSDFDVIGYFEPERRGMLYFWDNHKAISSAIESLQPTIFHAADLYVLPAVAKAAKATGAALVYDARELYPFVAGTVGKPWATFFWQMVESKFIRNADLVLTVNESISKRLIAAYGIDKPLVVPNVPPMQEVIPANDWLRRKFSLTKNTV